MVELVDVNEAREQMLKLLDHHLVMKNYAADNATQDCIEVLNELPIIDAQPVVHGRWIESVIERTMGALNGYKCSVCGHEKIGRTCLYNYCPECGAKMDEKVNE